MVATSRYWDPVSARTVDTCRVVAPSSSAGEDLVTVIYLNITCHELNSSSMHA